MTIIISPYTLPMHSYIIPSLYECIESVNVKEMIVVAYYVAMREERDITFLLHGVRE